MRFEENKRWSRASAKCLDTELYENNPKIIRKEYERIFLLLDEGQTYGAVLQLRDVYELSLKIPVIISLSYIRSKSRLEEKHYKILESIIRKVQSKAV